MGRDIRLLSKERRGRTSPLDTAIPKILQLLVILLDSDRLVGSPGTISYHNRELSDVDTAKPDLNLFYTGLPIS